MTLALGIMASGNGSNAQAIIDAVQSKSLDADIRMIFANTSNAFVLERARAAGIPHAVLDHKAYATREAFDHDLVALFRDVGVDTIAMAGYMRLVTPVLLEAFPERILNIHPALLPAFTGVHGMEDALAWGVRLSGCTVHFVDIIMDHGAVIIQAAVPSVPGESRESLATRIHTCEHRIYPQALSWLAQDRLRFIDPAKRWVELLPAKNTSQKILAPLTTATENVLISPALDF